MANHDCVHIGRKKDLGGYVPDVNRSYPWGRGWWTERDGGDTDSNFLSVLSEKKILKQARVAEMSQEEYVNEIRKDHLAMHLRSRKKSNL